MHLHRCMTIIRSVAWLPVVLLCAACAGEDEPVVAVAEPANVTEKEQKAQLLTWVAAAVAHDALESGEASCLAAGGYQSTCSNTTVGEGICLAGDRYESTCEGVSVGEGTCLAGDRYESTCKGVSLGEGSVSRATATSPPAKA